MKFGVHFRANDCYLEWSVLESETVPAKGKGLLVKLWQKCYPPGMGDMPGLCVYLEGGKTNPTFPCGKRGCMGFKFVSYIK